MTAFITEELSACFSLLYVPLVLRLGRASGMLTRALRLASDMLNHSLRAICSDASLPTTPDGTREISTGPVKVARAISAMTPSESPRPEPKPNPLRLSCPECKGILMPLPGNSAVSALERHLEHDHWYPWQLAHDAAMNQFALHKAVPG